MMTLRSPFFTRDLHAYEVRELEQLVVASKLVNNGKASTFGLWFINIIVASSMWSLYFPSSTAFILPFASFPSTNRILENRSNGGCITTSMMCPKPLNYHNSDVPNWFEEDFGDDETIPNVPSPSPQSSNVDEVQLFL
jgi:hypothetical protein